MLNRKNICIAMAIFSSILIILVMVLTSIELISFNKNFYRRQYERSDTARIIGITDDELLEVTDEFLLYLRDRREDLNIRWSKGESIFGEREIEHMKDVKLLFLYGFKLRNMASVFVVLLIVLMSIIYPKLWLKYLSFAFILTSMVVVILGILIAIGIAMDFDFIWDKFHHIFFNNDLWLLDPNTDVLIMMMPGDFFINIIKGFATIFFAGMGIMLILSFYMHKRYCQKTN